MDMHEKKVLTSILLKEAIGEEHIRLNDELERWAINKGYIKKLTELPNGCRPDVLMIDDTERILLIADAKDAASETIRNNTTCTRIYNYISEFAKLISINEIDGGEIAICTNTEIEAENWLSELQLMTMICGLTKTDGKFLEFRIEKINDNTWVVFA